MTLHKNILFIVGFLCFGFLFHFLSPSGQDSSPSAIASVPPAPESASTPLLVPPLYNEISGKINCGDTLSKSLRRYKIPESFHNEIIKSLKKSLDLRTLRPGDTFTARLDDNNGLVNFKYQRGPFESYTVSRENGIYQVTRDKVELEAEIIVLRGKIENSLFKVFLDQGESGKLVYDFADIFSAKIDFNTECRKGDKIEAVFEKYYKNDKFVGYGRILYGGYRQQFGNSIEGLYYSSTNTDGAYFAEDGQELGSSFIKSPLPVGRLTSKFSLHRNHPILHVVRPHLGIDLAAPIGTQIMAASDGKVVFAGYRGGFGRQVIIAHANGYKTYYAHLSRFKKGLKKGDRVKQKEIIGYVGSSGMSTGPHLDYRISLNGVFKNPLAIKFKPKSFLRGDELAAFQQQKEKFKEKIDLFESQQIIEVRQIVLDSEKDITKIL